MMNFDWGDTGAQGDTGSQGATGLFKGYHEWKRASVGGDNGMQEQSVKQKLKNLLKDNENKNNARI